MILKTAVKEVCLKMDGDSCAILVPATLSKQSQELQGVESSDSTFFQSIALFRRGEPENPSPSPEPSPQSSPGKTPLEAAGSSYLSLPFDMDPVRKRGLRGTRVYFRPDQLERLPSKPLVSVEGDLEHENLRGLFADSGESTPGRFRTLIVCMLDVGEAQPGMLVVIMPPVVLPVTRPPTPPPRSDEIAYVPWWHRLGNGIRRAGQRLKRFVKWVGGSNTSDVELGRADGTSLDEDRESMDVMQQGHVGDVMPPGQTQPLLAPQQPPEPVAVPVPPHLTWTTSLLADVSEQIGIALQQAQLMSQARLRMAELSERNEALLKARNEIKIAQAQKDFTAVMSHEIRTPLFAISALSSMLIETLKSQQESWKKTMDEAVDVMNMVKKSGDLLVAIVNNILDFAKYEEDGFTLDRIPFSVREAVEGAAEIVAIQDVDGRFPFVTTSVSDRVPAVVVGDVTRFRQILVNLLSNACKFTPSDGKVSLSMDIASLDKWQQDYHGQISGRSRVLGDGKVQVVVEVADTGIGIKQEDLGVVFGRFVQADSSITRKYGGTGLGLAIAKKLCDLMGGDIGVRANWEEGKGTRFSFYVSLETVNDEEPAKGPGEGVYDGLCVAVVDGRGAVEAEEHVRACSKNATIHTFSTLSSFFQIPSTDLPNFHAILVDHSTIPSSEHRPRLHRLCQSPAIGPRCGMLCTPFQKRSWREETSKWSSFGGDHSVGLMRPMKMDQVAGFLRKVGEEFLDMDALREVWDGPAVILGCEDGDPNGAAGGAVGGDGGKEVVQNDAGGVEERVGEEKVEGKHGVSILVVEDNRVNQMVIRKMLNHLGYGCDVAGDGIEALEAMLGSPEGFERYAVVFMDIVMPLKDGYETTRDLRSLVPDETKRPWVIGLTANAGGEDRIRCLEVGMNDFISKPASIDDLRAAMSRYFTQLLDGNEGANAETGLGTGAD
ncbi:hypothetical protein HDU97_000286, partial [Phlyctochytrium planicorne]